jgi:hypothetical protein
MRNVRVQDESLRSGKIATETFKMLNGVNLALYLQAMNLIYG